MNITMNCKEKGKVKENILEFVNNSELSADGTQFTLMFFVHP